MSRNIEKRPFGRTGHLSTVTLFGAAALKNVDQATADKTLDILLEYGVNHIDVAPRYGVAEERIGSWMSTHRKNFFLATKTEQRSGRAARDQLSVSLDRLKTDCVDLIQLHALYHPDEWDAAFGEGGVLQALVDARDEGLVRYIGVTGHGWTIAAMHKRSLAEFDFDSVLLPYNPVFYANPRYAREFDEIMKLADKRNFAVQTIKSIARGPWASKSEVYNTWYEPLSDLSEIDKAVHWCLSRPGIFINTVGDVTLLPKVLDAAARYEARPDDATIAQFKQDAKLTSLFGLGT